MVPGMDHCGGGEGASNYDTLGTIDAWASGGPAPETILATRGGAGAGGPPGAPKLPPISRPLCSFPKIATYKGKRRRDGRGELQLHGAEEVGARARGAECGLTPALSRGPAASTRLMRKRDPGSSVG